MFNVIKKLTSFVAMVAVLFAFTTEAMAKKSKTLKNTFLSLNENNNQKKILAKKNSLIYTRFRHYLVLKKLLSFQ